MIPVDYLSCKFAIKTDVDAGAQGLNMVVFVLILQVFRTVQ